MLTTNLSDTCARAIAGYLRCGGTIDPDALQAEAISYQNRDYVVVGTVASRQILTVYRIARDGSMRLLGSWPRALQEQHRARPTSPRWH
jgi:hypothetical protein